MSFINLRPLIMEALSEAFFEGYSQGFRDYPLDGHSANAWANSKTKRFFDDLAQQTEKKDDGNDEASWPKLGPMFEPPTP